MIFISFKNLYSHLIQKFYVMRHKLIVIISALTLVCSSLYSQKSFMKFGNISDEDLKMTSYSQDTSAGAVVLGNFGTTSFDISEDEGFFMIFTKHIRIKILDKSELDKGDFSVSLYESAGGSEERLSGLKACTYNLEGEKVTKYKLERKNIFREKTDKNFTTIKFSLPNVKVGSVIEVEYSINSPFIFNLQSWYFQSDIPTTRSEYHVYIPEYYKYKNWSSGYIPIIKESETSYRTFQFNKSATVTSSGRESGEIISFKAQITHWSYVAENVPAFKNEPYITTVYDYLSNIDFELVSEEFPGSIPKYYTRQWEDIRKELMDDEDFGKQLDNAGHMKDQITSIDATTSDPLEKMVAAYEYIKNSMKWDGRYRIWAYSGIRKPYIEGAGSSAEMNLNLVALCRNLGLKADPVLVSTRGHGKLKPGQVILSQFNHVIAAVTIDDNVYVLDCIDSDCPYYILPPNTLNGKGMKLTEVDFSWIDLYSDVPYDESVTAELSINDELQFEGKISKKNKNFAALSSRKKIRNESSQEEYLRKLEQSMDGIQLNDLKIENLDSIYKPLSIEVDAVIGEKITEGGDMFYFNPVLFDRRKENPFKNDERQYPIDYNYPYILNQLYTFSIPQGYTVEELPSSVKIYMAEYGGSYFYTISQEADKITLKTEFAINQTIYPSINYGEIKKFYEEMVAKQAELVILKKLD